MEEIDKNLVKLERGFASRDDDVARGVCFQLFDNRSRSHQCEILMTRIAESAFQIASAEAQEHCRCAGEVAFTLEGIEYLVYAIAH